MMGALPLGTEPAADADTRLQTGDFASGQQGVSNTPARRGARGYRRLAQLFAMVALVSWLAVFVAAAVLLAAWVTGR